MPELYLENGIIQGLTISPKMIASIKVLQMNSQELIEHINTIIEDNPVLECETDNRGNNDDLLRQVPWLNLPGSFGQGHLQADSFDNLGKYDKYENSISEFLKDQLDRGKHPPQLVALAKYMAEMIDENGYMDSEDLKYLATLSIPENMITSAQRLIQNLEPAGIGATTLQECLMLQLERLDDSAREAKAIVASYMEQLSKRQYREIAKKLNCPLSKIIDAVKTIKSLQPRPGQTFFFNSETNFIWPDIYIAEIDGIWQSIFNSSFIPKTTISDYYLKLLKNEEDKETKDYLEKKISQAKWFLYCMERRKTTLEKCGAVILEKQLSFFAEESNFLAPMTLNNVADQLNVHESTISRAIQGKYLQCKQGIFPMRYFFSSAVGGEVSKQAVKNEVAKLICNENVLAPLSDQKLADILCDTGYIVSRRAVAKYRAELGIPPAFERKSYR